ncbi:phage tail sheath subtilisin-like domain-containing protein [Xanthomonas campestris pv. phormiicola]|nr:phage tail sheath subtilisin-like domain-containing protein [Xanthomonas campestris pv. phormiicola]UYC18442.1 phage tail sheath subtilisin-like domain-containing protein [Xanthomonas campestris pv. phormiicola]
MATNYYHPGVYIEEIPSARTIQGVSTSTAVFVGVTEFGSSQQPTLITSWSAYQRQFGGLVWNGMVSWAVFEFFNEGGTACYIVRVADTKGTGKQANAAAGGIKLSAVTPGPWANVLGFTISNASGPDSAVSQVFNLSIVVDPASLSAASAATATLQAYIVQNNLALQPILGKSYYVLEAYNGYTASSMGTALPAAINANSMFVRAVVTGSTRPPNSSKATPLQGGAAATWDFESATATLTNVQGASLLAMPDTVNATDAGGLPSIPQQAALISAALLFCEGASMRNLFYVCDPPFDQTVAGISSFKAGSTTAPALNSSYGAIYYPWVWIYNPVAGANVPIPPSGPVLGRYAFTDNNVGVWKSPAGVGDGALLSVVQLNAQINDADQDTLNPQGINAIRNFLRYGNVIWGARTLVPPGSDWTYLSVRRLFIYIEQSLKQSLQWVVFEPNDAQTWASVTRDVGAFLTALWQAGGLFGATAAESFFVTCDTSNNPPETRVQGQMYIDVGVAPVRPAEFVIIRMTQKTAGPDASA